MSVKVKICGITRLEDAEAAADAGADALGFVFYAGSPRHLSLAQAAGLIARLPRELSRVGLFVNPTADEVHRAIVECGIDVLQFHGEETPRFLASLRLPEFPAHRPIASLTGRRFCSSGRSVRTIKAFRVRNEDSLAALPSYETDLWLLDSFVRGNRGGTGARFNWDLAVRAKTFNVPIVLAGGLNPDNVAEAVRHVEPYAVDVSSGVESAPGRKDPARIRAFIRAAKSALG